MPKTIVPRSASQERSDDPVIVDGITLAAFIGVSKRTIENWVGLKKIPYLSISRRCVRFNVREVLRHIEDKYAVRARNLEDRSKKEGAA